ncbi:MAG: HNH endonuclease [Burkholderiaceae bacterium]|nr:HNH endonuclease [Burkholderiaceae bacterium]
MSIAELEAQITELAGHLNAANHRWLVLIAEFDRREGWADGSTRSCAHWLSWKCGVDLGAAREKVRVARALAALPKISAAMAGGELSYSKVRALSRVATPATEDTLLMIALHGTAAHVETVVRHFRRAQESIALDREARQLATRGLHYHYDDDGALVLQARLPAEAGALLVKALDQATAGWHRDRRDRDVSAETLADGSAAQSGTTPAPTLAAETARRLACDASIVRIVEDGQGRPLDVGRKTRSIPPSIRRALQSRDGGCRFPGCTHTRFLDGHHIRHWADGGATRLSNLVLLCRHHHRQVHEGRVEVQVLDDGALRFKGPDGRAFEAAPGTRGDSREIVLTHRREGLAIDAGTAVTRWAGERMDYAMAVEGLLRQQERGEAGNSGLGVSAQTHRVSPEALPIAGSPGWS